MSSKDHLVWIDLEMTGLIPEQDSIIEIATVVTDRDLNVIADGPELAIHQERSGAGAAWMSGTRRTTARAACSRACVPARSAPAEAEAADAGVPRGRTLPPGASPMCGNSICQDRRFLARWMPALEKFFHYRNLDVSTLKELAARWHPQLSASFNKQAAHLARADVYESIAELRHYRERLFIKPA